MRRVPSAEDAKLERLEDKKFQVVAARGGIYDDDLDDGISRFMRTARDMSEKNLEALDTKTNLEPLDETIDLDSPNVVPVLQPGLAKPRNEQERVSALENDLANAVEVAKVAEAAAARANAQLAMQQRRLMDNELKVQVVESNLSSQNSAFHSEERDMLNQIAQNSSLLPDLKSKTERTASAQRTFQEALRLIESRLNVASQQAFNAEQAARQAVNESLKARNETAVMRAKQTNAAYAVEEMEGRLSQLRSMVSSQANASNQKNTLLEEMVTSLQADLSHLKDHSLDAQ